MTFSEIHKNILGSYNSKINNVTTEFFIPILKESQYYARIAGLFSSTTFALCARGLQEFIANEGKMELIISPVLSNEDIAAMQEVYDEKIVGNRLEVELTKIENEFEKNHINALKFLLKKNILEIKVHIPKNDNGIPLNKDQILEKNIFAEKRGIFRDRDSKFFSFRGPIDESSESWECGNYQITVDYSDIPGQLRHVEDDITIFQRLWNDKNTFPLPKTIQHLLETDVPSDEEVKSLSKYDVPPWAKLKNGKTLWDHNIRAVKAWLNNNFQGILSICTGGGKTLAALVAASVTMKGKLIIIIVPKKNLALQWKEEIEKFESELNKQTNTIICDSDHLKWKEILPGKLTPFLKNSNSEISNSTSYVISVSGTATTELFQSYTKNLDPKKVMIIGDEVHHYGAPGSRVIFEIPSSKRLGLSATFIREYDEIGTENLINFFGRELKEASYEICDGIKDGNLARYNYYPFFAYLNENEMIDYVNYTKEIRILLARINQAEKKHKRDLQAERILQRKLDNRAEIIKKAEDKVRAYTNILENNPTKPYVVFCDDNNQLNKIGIAHKEKIKDLNMQTSKNESFVFNIYSGDMDSAQQKMVIDDALSNQTPIFAMYCLDEGVSLPELQGAIIISSTASNRQYIQRRGRILRTTKKNKIAKLYDIIVLPSHSMDPNINSIMRDSIENEKNRLEELTSCAENKWEARRKLDFEIKRYFDST